MQQLGNIVRSAAIEIGSGTTRFSVADVLVKDDQVAVEKIQIEEAKNLFFAEHASQHENRLEETIYQTAFQMLERYLEMAKQLDAKRICIVATDIFRKAENGEAFINKLSKALNSKIQIINQNEEGELGFLTVSQFVNECYPSLSLKQLMIWDAGNSSAQISALHEGEFIIFKSAFGRVPILSTLKSIIGSSITKEDIRDLKKYILDNTPKTTETFKEKISSNIVFRKYSNPIITELFGDVISKPITKKMVKIRLKNYLYCLVEKTLDWDQKLDRLVMLVSIQTMMKSLNIPSIKLIKVENGNTRGMFLKQSLWE